MPAEGRFTDIRFMVALLNNTLKSKMLETCIMKQQALIDDFKLRIQNLLDTPGLGNEDEYDNQELAQKSQVSVELTSLSEALNFAQEELKVLLELKASNLKARPSPALGSVVVTNRNTFFVGVSTEQFEVDGKSFIGLSMKSPLYNAMKGKVKGDKFSCKGITYRILDVF